MTRTVDLYADDGGTGDGLPVVFLHSLAGNASQWSAQLDHLRPIRRAVALEWRGHGLSGAPEDGDYSVPAAANDVGRAVERLGIERMVLVGHSGGGLVALQYAADHPDRVVGLLLVDPSGDSSKVPAEQTDPFLAALDSEAYAATIRQYWGFILTGTDPAVRARVMAALEATPKETVVGFFEAGRHYDPLPALRSYDGPMLSVVTPINDEPFSLHNLGTGLPRTTFTATSHWLHMDKPEEFNHVLDEFLARTS
jgi:pimeloyl-ACP methyl ester carboxylesterase